MRTMPWIINARHFGFVVCVVLSFGIANAADTPTTTPAAAKVNPAPKKKTGATLQRQQPVAKKYSSSEETLRTALKQQIWLAQHKKPAAAKGNQPGQASKSIAPVSHNASLTPTRYRAAQVYSGAEIRCEASAAVRCLHGSQFTSRGSFTGFSEKQGRSKRRSISWCIRCPEPRRKRWECRSVLDLGCTVRGICRHSRCFVHAFETRSSQN